MALGTGFGARTYPTGAAFGVQGGGLGSRLSDWKPPVLPNVTQQANLFKSLFPDSGGGQSAVNTVTSFLDRLPQVPTIAVPTIPKATIAIPAGGYDQLQQAVYA